MSGGALQPGLVAGLIVEHLAAEAAPFRPLEVHAQQHLGPVLRLDAAGARVDGDDGVGAVVLAAEHLLDLGGLDFGLEFVEAALQVGGHVLAGVGPLDQDAEIGDPPAERVAQLGVLAQAALPLQRPLRLLLVVPEVGRGDPGFERGDLSGVGGPVKDSSADRWPA